MNSVYELYHALSGKRVGDAVISIVALQLMPDGKWHLNAEITPTTPEDAARHKAIAVVEVEAGAVIETVKAPISLWDGETGERIG